MFPLPCSWLITRNLRGKKLCLNPDVGSVSLCCTSTPVNCTWAFALLKFFFPTVLTFASDLN